MQNQELTYKAIYSKLAKRTEKYAADVRNVYLKRMGELAMLCEGVEIPDGKVFHFNDYPEIATEAQKQLRAMYSELYQCVRGDVTREWYYANDDVDRLVKAMFGKEAAEQHKVVIRPRENTGAPVRNSAFEQGSEFADAPGSSRNGKGPHYSCTFYSSCTMEALEKRAYEWYAAAILSEIILKHTK